MHDIIVVGGGPAGMTAALYALRNGKSALVIEKAGFGGQITHSPKVENFPGTLSMSGNEYADKALEQILAQGADIEIDSVTAVEDHGDKKVVVNQFHRGKVDFPMAHQVVELVLGKKNIQACPFQIMLFQRPKVILVYQSDGCWSNLKRASQKIS